MEKNNNLNETIRFTYKTMKDNIQKYYSSLILISVWILMYVFINIPYKTYYRYKIIYYGFMLFFLSCIILHMYIKISHNDYNVNSYLLNVLSVGFLSIIIISCILIVVYFVYSSTIDRRIQYHYILIAFLCISAIIMYIVLNPITVKRYYCMFSRFITIDMFSREKRILLQSKLYENIDIMKRHNNVPLVLFMFCLVFSIFILPPMLTYLRTFSGKTILYEPLSLDKQQYKNEHYDKLISKRNHHFSLELSVFVDQNNLQRNSNVSKPVNILNFGEIPVIQYQVSNQTLYFQINNTTIGKISDIPLQRWNYIVINCDYGIYDIFMNGTLQDTTMNKSSDIRQIPYVTNKSITIGAIDGVLGGIKKIYYHERPIPSFIIFIRNLIF